MQDKLSRIGSGAFCYERNLCEVGNFTPQPQKPFLEANNDSLKVTCLIYASMGTIQNFPLCTCAILSVCVCVCEDRLHTLDTNFLWKDTVGFTLTHAVPLHQYTQWQMCCNVMLSVINKAVCLTAPTGQGNKNYTHTDIRVVYKGIFLV